MSALPPTSPELSVIVPAYCAAATIDAALDSVLTQAGVDVECIVVDDASTDGTADHVASRYGADPRVVLLRQPANAGVSAARNRALEHARGEWLIFLDADDRLRPDALASLLRAARDSGARLVVGQRISTDGERWWYPKLYQQPDIQEAGRKSLATNPGLLYYLGPPGKLYHRSLAEGSTFEGRMLGDQPWVLAALVRAGGDIVVIEDVVYEWWRPADDATETITTSRTHSARLGAAAVGAAAIAFRRASEEFSGSYDTLTRDRLLAIYCERLVRSELGAQYRHAVRTGDPFLPAMQLALADLFAAVPSAAIPASALMKELIAPALSHWHDLAPDARSSFWVMLRVLVRAQPRVSRAAGRRLLRYALWTGVHVPVAGPWLGSWAITMIGRLPSHHSTGTPTSGR